MPETDIEKKISAHEKKYGLLAKKLVDVVFVIDIATMSYVYISPSVEKIRGFAADDLKNRYLKEHLTPPSFNLVTETLFNELKIFENGVEKSKLLELEMYRKDGSIIWMEIIARFYRENDGTVRVIGISKDITERKTYEEERENLILKLEKTIQENERLLKENRILRGLLPICAECKKIRDEDGNWHPIEAYIKSRTEADFTHTICPECTKKLYPGFDIS